ncbi:hypothetical protein ACS0TY_010166 [Phlomoides rotata]
MASTKTTLYLSLAILATVFAVSASAGKGGRGGGKSFCGGAEDPVLCNQLTGGAKTWGAAMTNAINGVLGKVNAGKKTVDIIGAKLPRNLKPISKQSITGTCHEGLENIIDNLQQCLGYVKSDPTSALRSHLSAITFSDCTDGLEEFGLDVPEATQFANDVLRLASALLTVAAEKK